MLSAGIVNSKKQEQYHYPLIQNIILTCILALALFTCEDLFIVLKPHVLFFVTKPHALCFVTNDMVKHIHETYTSIVYVSCMECLGLFAMSFACFSCRKAKNYILVYGSWSVLFGVPTLMTAMPYRLWCDELSHRFPTFSCNSSWERQQQYHYSFGILVLLFQVGNVMYALHRRWKKQTKENKQIKPWLLFFLLPCTCDLSSFTLPIVPGISTSLAATILFLFMSCSIIAVDVYVLSSSPPKAKQGMFVLLLYVIIFFLTNKTKTNIFESRTGIENQANRT